MTLVWRDTQHSHWYGVMLKFMCEFGSIRGVVEKSEVLRRVC
jgi:hypothetical protein